MRSSNETQESRLVALDVALDGAWAELEGTIEDLADLVAPMIRDGRMNVTGYASVVKNMLDKSPLVAAMVNANPYLVPAMVRHPKKGALRMVFLEDLDEDDENSVRLAAARVIVLLVSEALKDRGIDLKDLPG